MLKTVKNGSWIRVDPPIFSKFPHFPVFLGSVPWTVSYSILQEKNAFLGFRAEMLFFLGFVQKYYCPELLQHGFLVQGLF